ncbi:MAG: glycosyltransferase [Acidobacteria bacterium]|nr:glycosyltransferase [Acidobacteriota bacterium]
MASDVGGSPPGKDSLPPTRGNRPSRPVTRLRTGVEEIFMRIAASGVVSPRFFQPSVPDPANLPARTGHLSLEVVSHCWQYHFLLAYQLSSLVNHPPSGISVTMTVFYAHEDRATGELLEFFGGMAVPGVTWNWIALERELLFRRAIGRNFAARNSSADWIWFTDCDVVFYEGCLDGLAQCLEGKQDRLVFPRIERTTSLLDRLDPMLTATAEGPRLVEIDTSRFEPRPLGVAKGPMQITHGDVARAVGYCEVLPVYHRPAERWRKAWEDRAFRWLLRSDGTPLDIPAVYRIRHASKGRYGEPTLVGRLRGAIRGAESRFAEKVLRRK